MPIIKPEEWKKYEDLNSVAQMVSRVHSRGDEFRKAWNKDYGVEEEKANGGVVNPAILTVNKSKP